MAVKHSILIRSFLAALLVVAGNYAWSNDSDGSLVPLKEGAIPVNVTDLHFGDVLYQYYQDRSFDSLVRLLAYSETGRLPAQKVDAELLEAGIWLELGLHQQATQYLERILVSSIPEAKKQIARMFLARMWYRRGDDEKTVNLLEQMKEGLSVAMEAERVHLLSNALIHQGRYAAAADLLRSWSGSGDWAYYARFNLGVALLRDRQIEAGTSFLDELGQLSSARIELLTLRDRANLALGFALLDVSKTSDAQTYFRRVRLAGPYATRAMLGSGWADTLQGKYREALTPWLALYEKKPIDTAVLESLISVPHLYEALGAPAQAAEHYEIAISLLKQERTVVGRAIDGVVITDHFEELLLKSEDQDMDVWLDELRSDPESPEARYLYEVFAGPDFQEGIKIYRETRYLANVVQSWRAALDLNREATSDQFNTSLLSRIKADEERYEILINQIANAQRTQLRYLSDLVARGLQAQQSAIDDYISEAHFQLAKIYDQAGLRPDAKGQK